MNTSNTVDTPAYGLKTPEGIEMTACSWWFSTSSFRMLLCALEEPNKTPSGTMQAQRPPFFSICRKSARKSSSVFLVLVTAFKSSLMLSMSIVRYQKTCCTTGRITNRIIWCGLQQFDHHFSDMFWCAELSILSGCCQFAQHILV